MSDTIFFLGTHPVLSAVELQAYAERYGIQLAQDAAWFPTALAGRGALPSSPPEVLRQLGGTLMIGTLRQSFDRFPEPSDILAAVPEISVPQEGKRVVALSAYPVAVGSQAREEPGLSSADVRRLAMELKRALGMKATRVVFPPARALHLSTAQLLHNGFPRRGIALAFLISAPRVDLVRIEAIQDIEGYARRDRGRPQVDPGRGMLPPKLAQMFINLSLVPPGGTIYDPFCGVGTLVAEGALMGLTVVASDRSDAQVRRTKDNLTWLVSAFPSKQSTSREAQTFVHDLAKGPVPLPPQSVDAVVTEGWLGPARTTAPPPREAADIFETAASLVSKLLQRAAPVLRPGGRVLLAVPAFRVKKRVLHFPFESVRARGYERESLALKNVDHPLFRGAASGTLLYGRPDAIVLREIVRFHRR